VLCAPFLLAPTLAFAGALDDACITVHPGPAVPDSKFCLPTHTGVSTDFWEYATTWPEITAGDCNMIEAPRSLLSVGIVGYGTIIGYPCADPSR